MLLSKKATAKNTSNSPVPAGVNSHVTRKAAGNQVLAQIHLHLYSTWEHRFAGQSEFWYLLITPPPHQKKLVRKHVTLNPEILPGSNFVILEKNMY